MKKLLISSLSFFLVQLSFGQSATTTSTGSYTTMPMPPFTIVKVPDSTVFTRGDLDKDKETIFMYFSPDCEHCQRETDSLIAHIDLFKNVQIVMISPLDFAEIKKFYVNYGIANHPGITMARDGAYILGGYFKIHNFPSFFIYDKDQQYKTSFEGSYPIEKVAAAL